jgi:predicted flap endonuclease-1-like 5' DNA nuclease
MLTGINQKTEALLQEGGIFTFHRLAQTDAGRLLEILNAAEQPYDLNLLLSWPYQAQLAAAGRRERLAEVQAQLKEQTAEPEKASADDLTRIYGINAALQTLFQENKLATFARLADSNTGHLQQLVSDSSEPYRLADLITWPYQARLILDGETAALKHLRQS